MVGEASRANGGKGGRPKGSLRGQLSSAAYEARKVARRSLQELCQEQEEAHVAVLQAIAGDSEEPANARISATAGGNDRVEEVPEPSPFFVTELLAHASSRGISALNRHSRALRAASARTGSCGSLAFTLFSPSNSNTVSAFETRRLRSFGFSG